MQGPSKPRASYSSLFALWSTHMHQPTNPTLSNNTWSISYKMSFVSSSVKIIFHVICFREMNLWEHYLTMNEVLWLSRKLASEGERGMLLYLNTSNGCVYPCMCHLNIEVTYFKKSYSAFLLLWCSSERNHSTSNRLQGRNIPGPTFCSYVTDLNRSVL